MPRTPGEPRDGVRDRPTVTHALRPTTAPHPPVGQDPPHKAALRQFRTACFEAARRTGARVESLELPGAVRSFEAARITNPTGSLVALRHTDRPIVAFTGTPPVPARPVSDFVDPPAYADVFEAFG